MANPDDLLNNLIVKRFDLKDANQQLLNTVSGNLVVFDRNSKQKA